MAFFTVDTSEENIRDYSGNGNFISKSGIYEIVLKRVIVEETSKGSVYVNFFVEHNGVPQMLYQAIRLCNNDGSENFGTKMFNKLCGVCGLSNGAVVNEPVYEHLPIGKDKEEKECAVLKEFDDTPMFIRVQEEYSVYNDEIRKNLILRNIFRYTDKATASEIINDVPNKGEQYLKEEPYADAVSYKNGLTEEDIANWEKEGKSKKQENKPSNGFGKRTFGKK